MIELKEVSKQFSSGRGHVAALSNITFTAQRGQRIVLAGKSGSGKTTLLNCIGTLETPDRGQIVCDDIDLCTLSARQRSLFRRQKTGFVFQSGNLLPWLTVAENLQIPLELNGIFGKTQRVRIGDLLASFNLAGYEKALPAELSGGEAQRIAVARAMAHAPAILLADEPTASLDSANGQQLIELMAALCKDKKTTLFIATHDPELIAFADQVIALKDGLMAR